MAKNLPVVPTAVAGSLSEAPSGLTWREQYPVISEGYQSGLDLVLFCPEGALTYEEDQLTVNQKLCKGCGICANECEENAIQMFPEYTGARGVFR